MRAPLRLILGAVLAMAAAGCEVGDTGDDGDNNDDGGDSDGGDGGGDGGGITGLSIEWRGQPAALPGQISADLTITRAVFLLDDLRLVSDGGQLDLQLDRLEWAAGVVPPTLTVEGPSPGLYSRLLFGLEGDDETSPVQYGYEIAGSVLVNGNTRQFLIRDHGELALMLQFSLTLSAGQTMVIPVRFELDKIVGVVNFEQASSSNERYTIDNNNNSGQLAAVRTAVRAAIGITGPS